VPLVDVLLLRTAGKSSPESHPRRPPPLRVGRCLRRPSARVDALVEFAASRSASRTKSRLVSCPEARDRASPAIPPPRAAVSGEPAAGRPLVDDLSRPSPDLRSRSVQPRSQIGSIPVNRSVRHSFAQKPFLLLKFADRSSHHREVLTNRSCSLWF
jgi:hypothetical protein